MKKIYQNPEIKVIKVQLAQMITESIGFGNNYNGTKQIESRNSGSLWDDDAEDEDY